MKILLKPYKLFNRLALVSQRQLTIEQSLIYELTILPANLFDDHQFLRKAQKSKLAKHLKDYVFSTEKCNKETVVFDGGWLIHQITWPAEKSFKDITESYVTFILRKSYGKSAVAVFDGYANSPKDHDHMRRTKCHTGTINIIPDKPCPVSKTRFLSNVNNKDNFIGFMINTLSPKASITCLKVNDDCDTLVVKTALDRAAVTDVEIMAEDTDILIMLIYHSSTVNNNLFFTTSSGSYNIKNISSQLNVSERERILFIHSFTGCDTVSAIFGLGKVKILKKICNNRGNQIQINNIMNNLLMGVSIIDNGILLFQFIFGDIKKSLAEQRVKNIIK